MSKIHDMRAEVLDFYRPDVMALVETWLKGDEVIDVEGICGLVEIEGLCIERQLGGKVELGC